MFWYCRTCQKKKFIPIFEIRKSLKQEKKNLLESLFYNYMISIKIKLKKIEMLEINKI